MSREFTQNMVDQLMADKPDAIFIVAKVGEQFKVAQLPMDFLTMSWMLQLAQRHFVRELDRAEKKTLSIVPNDKNN